MKTKGTLFISALVLLASFAYQAKKTLKGTVWKSHYFKYDNYYHFVSDSSGYLESISEPIQGKNMTDKDEFGYKMKGDTLKIVIRDPNEFKYEYVRKKEKNGKVIFESLFSFSEGKEKLEQQKK